ncbi:MAG: efflux RND transporter periplasmic adaptor subunit [Gemmatimonadota bacterium]
MTTSRRRVLLPVFVIFAGFVAAAFLVSLAPETEAVVPERSLPTVRTEVMTAESVRSLITASGITSPAREVTVIPEVNGRVVAISDALVPGGRVQTGDVLVRINAEDYELAVEQQRGQVRSAELELELEEARQQTAREEWEILGTGGEPSPLVLRESQRAAAEMNLISSRSALARAELDLERTVIRAPFNASVVEESVDVGQVVGQQTTIARLVGTDQLRVTVSVRVEELALIDLRSPTNPGSVVTIRQRLGTGDQVEREGRVVSLVDQLDPQTRRAELLVLIDDPLDSDVGLPLLPGSSVDAEISGRVLDAVVRVPRAAIYDGDTVWIVNEEGSLERVRLEAVWGDDEAVYVRTGLAAGTSLVISPLSAPVEGTRVSVVADDR